MKIIEVKNAVGWSYVLSHINEGSVEFCSKYKDFIIIFANIFIQISYAD